MRYVARDDKGEIDAVFATPREGADEEILETEPELVAFVLGDESRLRAYLASTDAELLRVIEDVVNVLIDNNLVLLTDFPPAAREKLLRRKAIRDKLISF